MSRNDSGVLPDGADRPQPQHAQTDEHWLLRALDLAGQGPEHGPNPRVGCVLLDAAGRFAGEGRHLGAGTAHAEADALASAARRGHDVRGGAALVTLEPCTHTGRTPPCTDALLAAGIARVVIGSADPNPAAAGGAAELARHGVQVRSGVLADRCDRLNRRWLNAVRRGRPHVIWKFAATLDGRSAAADGSSKWITGPVARADVHARRAAVDAICVGTGTALADDPALTVRRGPDPDAEPLARQPLRVVIGRREIPPTARVRRAPSGVTDPQETLLLRTHDLDAALSTLHAREIRTLWLEGGPRLAAAFWRAGLVDEVLGYLAPALLGSGATALSDLGIDTIAGAVRLQPIELVPLAEDLLWIAETRCPREDVS